MEDEPKLKRYRVWYSTTASAPVEVVAETAEEALERAKGVDVDLPQLCHYCAGQMDLGDEWEIDGDPTELED